MERQKICLLFLSLSYVSGFNIGLKGVAVSKGASDSMHGYSLDFATKDNKVWLLVGSPKATDPDVAQKTGTVSYCGTSLNCQHIAVTRLAGITGIPEDRTDMWLGASVDVGNAVAFCGPRWRRNLSDDVTTMNGLCYEVPFGFLDGDVFLKPVIAPGFYNSLSNEQFTSPDAARFNQTIKYGLSSSGMAVKYFVGEVMVGSPGLNEFAGGYAFLSGALGYQVKAEDTTEAKQGQMYGYALAIGKFYGGSQTYFVSGGPRDGGSGKVLITDTSFVLKERLSGVEPGSYFGSVLCVVPASASGFNTDILLVGAPSFSNMQTYANNYYTNEEQGRVYVYQKSGNDASLQVIQTLEGSKSKGARFGFAMANLNDINKDGYNDVVIGAPFEDNDQGAVYVYMGYKRGFYLTQKFFASGVDFTPKVPIKTFGSAFTQHPADFNGDSHADLAVGAYESSSVFVFITNPPITMTVVTKTNLPNGGSQIIPVNTTKFTINVCFDYDGENIPSDVVAVYDVTVDTAFLASSGSSQLRLCFNNSEGQCVSKVKDSFKVFKAPPEPLCSGASLEVIVKDNWESMRGLFEPVVFDVEFKVNQSDNTQCIKGCPVVNTFDPANENPFAKARKYSYELARAGCGSDNICQSDLSLTVSASNDIVTGSNANLDIDVTIVTTGEPSYNTEIMFTFHPNMTYSSYVNTPGNRVSSVSCSPVNGTVKCSTEKQTFLQGETIKFKLTLDARRVAPLNDSFELKVEVKTGSKDVNVANNVYTKSIDVLTKVINNFYMVATPEVYITKPLEKDKPTIDVVHNVQMVNTGPSNLLEPLKFTFAYPQSQQVTPTKMVLNVSAATDETNISCTGLKLTPEGLTNSTFRAFSLSIDSSRNSRSASKFNCLSDGICSTATCSVGTFMYQSFISIDISYAVDANLYNVINDQESGNLKDVPIVTKFTLEPIDKSTVTIESNTDGISVMTRMLPSTPVEEEVPVWAYIVPIIIAIIILAVVIVILWKKGFFIRKYKVQMEEKKVESGAKSTKDKEEFDDLEKAANDIPAIVIENEQDKSPPMSTFSNTPPPSKKEQLNDSLEDEENSEFKTKETVTLHSSEETGSENSNGDITRDKDRLLRDDPETKEI
ncbi:integrin alpha-9 isoform X4 [Magallana gigas]|uniref:integrin alpha-9 isoform X4 n=1 Tax=Magallana gigas TaxID=29159 RepID=UPI0033424EC2